MFNSITGTITGKGDTSVCIDTHGIEWDIRVPRPDSLPPIGEAGKIFTWLYHTENTMALFGFASKEERSLFLDMVNKVDGIGPSAAVKILSHIDRELLVAALDSGDVASLEKLPGVGKKTAAKMMLALKGRLTIPSDAPAIKRDVPFGDVVDSLCSMGYDRRDCESTVARLAEKAAAAPDWEGKHPTEREDFIFRMALVELAR